MKSEDWDARYATSELIWKQEPNTTVAEHLSELPPGRALDFACGEGRHAIWLARLGWDVTAIDFSQVALDKGQTVASKAPRAVRGRIEWVRADLTDLQIAGGYQLVLIAYLHLPAADRAKVLRTAVDALEPAGTMLVLGHDSTNIADGFGGPQDPAILYTPHDVVDDLGPDIDIRIAEQIRRPTEGRDAIDALVVGYKPPLVIDDVSGD